MSQTKNKPIICTQSEIMTQKSIFWLSVLLFIAFPIVSGFILQTVVLNVSGNIAYKSLVPTLTLIRDIASVLCSYAGIGVMAAAVANYGIRNSFGTVILGLLSHTVGFFASMGAYLLSGAKNFAVATFTFAVDAVANTLIYAVILVALILIRKNEIKKGNLPPKLSKDRLIDKGGAYTYILTATGIFGIAQLATTLYRMVTDFLDPSIGVPINLQEWIYWVTEYLTIVIYLGIGYFIVLGVFWLCKYYKEHFSEVTE